MGNEDDLTIGVGLTEKRYLQSLARFEAGTVKAAQRAEKAFARSNQSFVRGTARANTHANAFARGGLRNVSLQMSQMTQQAMAGGDVVRALAIQLPDLALGFGTVGIAIGALGGVLLPTVVDMLGGADAAKELEDQLKSLETAIKAVEAAQANSGRSLADLGQQYGTLRGEALRLFEIQKQIAEVRAQRAFGAAVGGVAEGFGVGGLRLADPEALRNAEAALEVYVARYEALIARMESPGVSNAEASELEKMADALAEQITALEGAPDTIAALADRLNISADAAAEMAVLFAEVAASDGPERQAEAMQDLADHIFEATGGLAEADEKTQGLYDALLAAVEAALSLGAASGAAAAGIGTAADEAERLAAALDAQNRVNLQGSKDYSGRGGDPRKVGNDSYMSELGYKSVDDWIKRFTPKAGKGGAGAAKQDQELNRLLRERDRILRSLETATEIYARELADLEKLKAEGLITSDQYNAALADTQEKLVNARFGTLIGELGQVGDALAEVALNGGDAGDVVEDALKRIAATALSSTFNRAIENIGRVLTSGGGGSSVLGGLIGALIGRRAAGGDVLPGNLYAVNENTPNTEYFQPTGPGRILTPSQAKSVAPSAGGAGATNLNIDARGAQAGVAEQIVDALREAAPDLITGSVSAVRRQFGDMLSEYDTSGAMVR